MTSNGHATASRAAQNIIDQTGKLQGKVQKATGQDPEKHGPAGGFDSTPVPKAPPGYTLKITFHSATNLPFADLSLTSDPYILATFKTELPKRHKQDPDLRLRTPTVHKSTNPEWNCEWIIANVPASGFEMKCRLYDEDPTDHDDRLGNAHINVDKISDDWKGFKEKKFDIKKRMGSKRAYTLRGCMALCSRDIKMTGHVTASVENLGKSPGESGGKAYTVGPLHWTQHFSPLIGRLAGTKSEHEGKDGSKTQRYNFQAIQMQLCGPVPDELYHRYVEFRPFIAGMFTDRSIRGKVLNHALHHQHARIYNFDTTTKYGAFDHPCLEMTKRFLDFVHYDQGGRIFTYVITLDGHFRFTETGKEFGIDMLSKHTMHSDVSIYIAFSGEFFIRRLKEPHRDKNEKDEEGETGNEPSSSAAKPMEEQSQPKTTEAPEAHKEKGPAITASDSPKHLSPNPPNSEQRHRSLGGIFHRHRSTSSTGNEPGNHTNQTQEGEEPEKDPHMYELIIDNDSGTYRPNSKYLGELRHFLDANLVGMRVVTLDCQKDEERMKKLKQEQAERKKNSGGTIMYQQNSSVGSISSSDEEKLDRRVGETDEPSSNKVKNDSQDTKAAAGVGSAHGEKEVHNEQESKTEEAGNEKVSQPSGVKSQDSSQNHGQSFSENSLAAGTPAQVNPEQHQINDKSGATGAAAGAAGVTAGAAAGTAAVTAAQSHNESHPIEDEQTTPRKAPPQPPAIDTTAAATAGTAGVGVSGHDGEDDGNLTPTANRGSVSASSTDRNSFDTAFTGRHTQFTQDQFVTPKPSLGDGGLNQFYHSGHTDVADGTATPRADHGEDKENSLSLSAGHSVDGNIKGGEPGPSVHDTVTRSALT